MGGSTIRIIRYTQLDLYGTILRVLFVCILFCNGIIRSVYTYCFEINWLQTHSSWFFFFFLWGIRYTIGIQIVCIRVRQTTGVGRKFRGGEKKTIRLRRKEWVAGYFVQVRPIRARAHTHTQHKHTHTHTTVQIGILDGQSYLLLFFLIYIRRIICIYEYIMLRVCVWAHA